MDLPSDIIGIIFHMLPITDKRHLTITCHGFYPQTPILGRYITDFHKMISEIKYISDQKIIFNH